MSTMIERLRASKAKHSQEQEADAKQRGREWATDKAEFADLERISNIDPGLFGNGINHIWGDIKEAIDPEGALDDAEAGRHLFGDDGDYDEDWLIAWVEGAQEAFGEVQDQI